MTTKYELYSFGAGNDLEVITDYQCAKKRAG